jgi:hypothetical protein
MRLDKPELPVNFARNFVEHINDICVADTCRRVDVAHGRVKAAAYAQA